MRFFVTGGTGFIGSYAVQMLRDLGHEVTILARNPEKVAGFVGQTGLSFAQGDVLDYARFPEWLAGQDGCIHNALVWGDTAQEMLERDTRTSVVLAEAAGRAGVTQFLYTSSTAAFGAYQPRMTEAMKSDPIDWYCATKAATESYLIAASYKFPAMRVNIVRPGYTFGVPVFGGAAMGAHDIQEMVRKAKRGEDITVKENDGTQFIFAGDLMRLYRAVLTAGVNREIYHGVSQPFTTWEAVARLVMARTASSSRLILDPPKRDRPFVFDLAKIEQAFGLHFDPWPALERLVDHLASAE